MSKSKGRPALSEKQVDAIFLKLEPYLKAGLSINKACLKAKIPKSTVYDLKYSNVGFAEKIEISQAHQSILITEIISNELEFIKKKQKSDEGLTRDQIKFVQWVAMNSRTTKEEFNREEPIEKENAGMKMVEDDPRVLNTLIKSSQAMMENMGFVITHPSINKKN